MYRFAIARLGLNQTIIGHVIQEVKQVVPQWRALLAVSFLSHSMRKKRLGLLVGRSERLKLL